MTKIHENQTLNKNLNLDDLPDAQLYEWAVNIKHSAQERRDEINKFYISLFSIMVSVLPFISSIAAQAKIPFGHINNDMLPMLLSVIGLTLAISWLLMLKHTSIYLKGVEQFMKGVERKHNKEFMIFLTEYLDKTSAPERVTKQEMWVPYVFIMIFSLTLLSIGYDAFMG